MINKFQDLERDILFFYDYLLFLKETQGEDDWLEYVGVYHCARKLLTEKSIKFEDQPRRFKKKNYVSLYMKLSKDFCLDEFNGEIFDLDEVSLIRNQWRLFNL